MLRFILDLVENIETWTLAWIVVVNVFSLITFGCFLLVVNTNPGEVPNCSPWNPNSTSSSKDLIITSVEKKRDGRPRFCRICGKYKPDRTHHSRKVGKCVLEMDHYCPWVHNCIGYFNKKYFLLFIFYASITLICYCVAAGPAFVEACKNATDPLDYLVVFCWIFAALLGVLLTSFFIFHLWLLSKAYTTIEYCEKKLAPEKVKGTGDTPVKDLYAKSPYDRGLYNNWTYVLGPNPLLWLIPTRYGLNNTPLAGCTYKTNPKHLLTQRSYSGRLAVSESQKSLLAEKDDEDAVPEEDKKTLNTSEWMLGTH